jgi:hypothetical protein
MSQKLINRFMEVGKTEYQKEIIVSFNDAVALKEVRSLLKLATAFEENVGNFLYKFAVFAAEKHGAVSMEPLNVLIRELPKSTKAKQLKRFIETSFNCEWRNTDGKQKFWFREGWATMLNPDEILMTRWWVKPTKEKEDNGGQIHPFKKVIAQLERITDSTRESDERLYQAAMNALINLKACL